MPFPARSAAEGWGSRSDRERVARHVERVAEELARVVAPLDPVAAEGVLTSLLAAAERIRHGDTMGQVQIDAHALTDKRLGGGHAFFLEFERRVNKFHERSRPMTIEEAAALIALVRQMERDEVAGSPVDAPSMILASLPVDVEAWIGTVATAARASAPPAEVALWGERPPIVVLAGELVEALRLVIRIAG